MNILAELQQRFRAALAEIVDDPAELLAMIRTSGDPKFGEVFETPQVWNTYATAFA